MKLSEAILLGSISLPPSTEYCGCALAAACHAVGYNDERQLVTGRALKEWPWLASRGMNPDPSEPGKRAWRENEWTYKTIIEDLNGWAETGLRWNRPRIAEWVATIEATLPSTVEKEKEEQMT